MVTTVSFRDEAGEVVDVAVGVVAEDAAPQPDGVRRAQVVGKGLFVVHARHVRIALLHLAEQAFFGGEDGARAVDVDRSAFEDDAVSSESGRISRRMRGPFSRVLGARVGFWRFRHQAADFLVVPPVGIFCPGVEAKLEGERSRALLGLSGSETRTHMVLLATRQEDAAGVAQPDAVGGPAMEADVGRKGIGSFEHSARLSGGSSIR